MIEQTTKLETGAAMTAAGDEVSSAAADAKPTQINPDDLHDLFQDSPAAGSDEEDPLANLRNDPNYAALIRDLEYIAQEARNLFSTEGPSDSVWDNIQKKLGTDEE